MNDKTKFIFYIKLIIVFIFNRILTLDRRIYNVKWESAIKEDLSKGKKSIYN